MIFLIFISDKNVIFFALCNLNSLSHLQSFSASLYVIILIIALRYNILYVCCLDFRSSAVLLKPQPFETTRNSRESDGAAVETLCPSPSVPSSSLTAARTLLLSKLSETDKLFRRSGAESNSTTPEAARNSSNISIRFNKKAAEDSEDESEPGLDIKIPPPAVPVPADVESGEAVYVINLVSVCVRIFLVIKAVYHYHLVVCFCKIKRLFFTVF